MLFQYRKRYGLHAIGMGFSSPAMRFRFNTASGMDCMQLEVEEFHNFIASEGFNTASGMDCMQYVAERVVRSLFVVFQYRKRYGLHAMSAHRT